MKLNFKILIHPWKSLKDLIDWENISSRDLAVKTKISKKEINNIIKGKADITPDIALKLEKVFWISKEFWENLQKSYNKDKLRLWNTTYKY